MQRIQGSPAGARGVRTRSASNSSVSSTGSQSGTRGLTEKYISQPKTTVKGTAPSVRPVSPVALDQSLIVPEMQSAETTTLLAMQSILDKLTGIENRLTIMESNYTQSQKELKEKLAPLECLTELAGKVEAMNSRLGTVEQRLETLGNEQSKMRELLDNDGASGGENGGLAGEASSQ
uniref:Uncharacterized protein n=1 Tax=Bracon brevicornis TaxID=1563983 RepID=A0A6V7LAJ0_9HYME